MTEQACVEGADFAPANFQAAIPVRLVGDHATAELPGVGSVRASGPGCVATLARQLLASGIDADKQLAIFQRGDCIGKASKVGNRPPSLKEN
jgi:hypothetical protein